MNRLTIAPVARAYLMGLRARFELVLDQPMIGRQELDLGEGIRSIGFRSHRIYYRCFDAELIIVRILHYARDAEQIFPPFP